MNRFVLIALLLVPVSAVANQYYSAFPLTQNPVTLQGAGTSWINGQTTGVHWGNCASDSVTLHGTIISSTSTFNDNTCVTAGTWSTNQTAQAVVHLTNGSDSGSQEEVELRLNTSITSGSITGYEFDASVINGNPYLLIVRWNGWDSVNNKTDYTVLTTNALVAVHDGDTLKATNVGGVLTFYLNGVAERTVTDHTYTAGAPGAGFWYIGSNSAELAHFGFTNFAATDGGGPINALANCTQATMQSACNAVTTDNTLLTLPACSVSQTVQLKCTTTHSFSLMGLSIATAYNSQGNPTAFNDTTQITDGQSGTGGNDPIMDMEANGSSSQEIRTSGIAWVNGNVVYNGLIALGGSGGKHRFDHNHTKMSGSGELTIATYQPATGVADHNLNDVAGGNVYNWLRVKNSGFGDAAWAAPITQGTQWYMENNTINNGFMNDCSVGGTYVARMNTFNVTAVNANIGIQSHALGSQNGEGRGCRGWEVYGNIIGNGGGSITNSAEFQTAGEGIVWGNTVTNSKHDVDFNSDRETNSPYPESAPPAGWGYCGTHQSGVTSGWDQNTNSTGYACMDNIGRGQGDLLAGTFPTRYNTTTPGVFTGVWPHQAQRPVYIAGGETCSCSSAPFFATSPQNDLIANRDWYEPASPFTGATGTGTGTLASRPSTCTTGVGYWATDQGTWNVSGSGPQGQLYVCSATNTWSLYYTPYTYPHPLVGNNPTPPPPPVGPATSISIFAIGP